MSDLIEQCKIPPKGWICQRGKGHAGPCAANPLPEGMTEGQYWYSRWWDAVADDEAAQAITVLTAERDKLLVALDRIEAIGAAIHQQRMALERKAMTDTQPVVTQEDIEAVAIALCKEKFAEQEFCNPYWGPNKFGPPDTIAIAEIDKNFYRGLARAAIAAHHTASTAALQKQLDMAVNTVADYEAEITHLRADREAVIRECARLAEEGCLVPPDGGSPTEAEYQMCQAIKAAILNLISTPAP